MGIVWNAFLLRKNKIFNKSRYSRNRQTTRVSFYLSILINILVIFGVFVLYYKVLFKLGVLWLPFYFFLLSFLFSSFLRTIATTSLRIFFLFLKTLYNPLQTISLTNEQLSEKFLNSALGSFIVAYILRIYNYWYSFMGWTYFDDAILTGKKTDHENHANWKKYVLGFKFNLYTIGVFSLAVFIFIKFLI